jgi:hypothetical protein
MNDIRHPRAIVRLDLDGPDGNAFVVMGEVARALRASHAGQDEIDAFFAEINGCGSYDALLRICRQWVTFN